MYIRTQHLTSPNRRGNAELRFSRDETHALPLHHASLLQGDLVKNSPLQALRIIRKAHARLDGMK